VGQFEFQTCVIDTGFAVSALPSFAERKFQHPIWRDGPEADIELPAGSADIGFW
jgi:hypothetical protein